MAFTCHYPEHISPSINSTPYTSLAHLVQSFCQKFAQQSAFECLGATLSYADLWRQSCQFAAWLQQQPNLKPGDRIAVQLPNILQYPVMAFGTLLAGMVLVNTNPLYTEEEMVHQFNDCGAKLLVVYSGMAAKALRVQPQTSVKTLVVTDLADMHPWPKSVLINSYLSYVKGMVPSYDKSRTISWRQWQQQSQSSQWQMPDLSPDHLAVLQYTGGTTGLAKGAMLSHGNLLANMMQAQEFFNYGLTIGQERFVTPLPLYHIYAFTVHCLVLLHKGNTNILIPNPRDLPAMMQTLKKTKFTGMAGLNTLFVALMNHPDFAQLDFSQLKMVISGGMALPEATAKRWQGITGVAIAEGYGLTEASPVVTFNPADRVKLGTIGIPLPSTELATIDDAGQLTELGQPGELIIRGPQVMQGYWQRPADTAEVLDDQGWLRTGDIAILDGDGYVRLVDRKKDMVIVSGFNVYPNEVEATLLQHPAIFEAAVIGEKDSQGVETLVAFVVNKEPVTEQDLIQFCKLHLAAYKVPRCYYFRDELPKTQVGKVLRRALRETTDNPVA